MKTQTGKFIGIDFDGTVVDHSFPEIGLPIPGAIETIQNLIDHGHKIILYTMRSRETLVDAVKYLEKNGIELYGVNDNKTQHHWTKSPKVYCHIYIDDAALGCPLITNQGITGLGSKRPYVDWQRVNVILRTQGYLS